MDPPGYTPTRASEGAPAQAITGRPPQGSYFPPFQQPAAAGPSASTTQPPPPTTQPPPSTAQPPSITVQAPPQPPPPTNGSSLPNRPDPLASRRGSARVSGRAQGLPGRASTRLSSRVSGPSGYGGGEKANVKSIKISFKGAGAKSEAEGGTQLSFLGEYDRELDEDPKDPLAFEEQFILRVPKEIADGPLGLRESVKGKGRGLDGLEFRFLDSRRAAFTWNGRTYASKLVDLPNVIESQKTVDNRHLFKVADISQMLVVDNHPIRDESSITRDALRVDDYFWPHGVTPPLRHVRKRRFRHRLSRRTIEVVEEKVEELLRQDDEADEAFYDAIDSLPDDVPDSYYIHWDPSRPKDWTDQPSDAGASEVWDDPGSGAPEEWEDGEGEYSGEEYGDGEEAFDEELAQALREGMGGDSDAGSDEGLSADEDEDEEDDDGKSDDDDETAAKKAKIRQFTSEIKALEAAIEKKRAGFTRGNPIMEKRFNEQVRGLQDDVRMKDEARQALIDEIDEAAAAKRAPEPRPAAPTEKTARRVAIDDDAEMGYDATAGNTPGVNTPLPEKPSAGASDGEAEADGEDDNDDLFGDADADGEEEDEGHGVGGGDHEVEAQGGGDDADGEEDEDEEEGEEEDGQGEEEADDDLAAMLRAELEDLPASSPALPGSQPMDVDPAASGGAPPDEMAQANAMAALEDFALLGGLDAGSPAVSAAASSGFGVEGGVGMRRLATGIQPGADDDDDDSSDSDD